MKTITRSCPFTGKVNTRTIDVTPEEWSNWIEGMMIQDAMPRLTPSEREFIKTGITDDEWPKERPFSSIDDNESHS